MRCIPRARHFFHLLIVCGLLTISPCTSAIPQQSPSEVPPEADEKSRVDAQIENLKARLASLQKTSATLSKAQPETIALIQSQEDELNAQSKSLTEMSNKLQAVVEISSILPLLSGETEIAANKKLVDLRLRLAQARVSKPAASSAPAVVTPAATPPVGGLAPAPAAMQDAKPATEKNGSLWGRILDDVTGKPIPNARVIAKCGTNGDAQYTTRTDANGIYQFSQLTATPCLVQAAKFLNPTEEDILKASPQANNAAAKVDPNSSNMAVMNAVTSTNLSSSPPIGLRSYQVRTVKNIVPDTSGMGSTPVQEMRLSERKPSLGEFARVIVGFEQSGASSAPSVQKYFSDFWVSVPVPLPKLFNRSKSKSYTAKLDDFNFGYPFRLWGDFRITSVPQQISSSVGDFAISFADQISAVKVNEVAQGTEFMVGGEYRLFKWGNASHRFLSFDQSNRERFAAYFTAGYGRITPLNPKDSVTVFNNPTPGSEPTFDAEIAKLGLTNQLAGKPFVAFVPEDRYKFFKEYYAGFRVKTFYYDRDTDEPLGRFPATFEAVVGQNETVTGGRLHGAVARLEGFYPLPYDLVHFIYLFGTADLLLGGQRGGSAIILQPAADPPAIPDPSVFLIPTHQLNRDHYRIGVGIDFMQLVDAIKNRNKNNPVVSTLAPATTTPAPAAGAPIVP